MSSCSSFNWKPLRLGAPWLFPVLNAPKISATESSMSAFFPFTLFLSTRVDFFPLGSPSWWTCLSSLQAVCVWAFWGLAFSDTSIIFKLVTVQLIPCLGCSKIIMLLFFVFLTMFLTLKMIARKMNGRDVVHFFLSECSMCFSGLSSGGIVVNLEHTELFSMQLFLFGTISCWKKSPCTSTPLVSASQSWFWDTRTV